MKTTIPSLILVLLLILSAVRIASTQPSAQTLPASAITATSAQLNGNLNTDGQDTEWAFKVFDSSGNEIQTVCSEAWNAGSGGQSSVSCPVNSLQPSTAYGFALIARWTGGSGDWQLGNVVSFTTLANGPAAETDAATGVTDTSAVLNGVVTTNGQDTFWMFTVHDANSAFVQNCPSGNLQFVSANVGTQSVTCQVSQLQPSATYSFVLQACWQPSGTCTYGSSLSFTTIGGFTASLFTNVLTASHPATDWAISNLRITPSSPKVGDQLTFAVDLTAVSTNAPYPQSVDASCWVDNLPPVPPVGASPNGGATTYYGPTGTPMPLTVNYPWTATAGTHTTTCSVGQTNDPDASNNKVSLTFTIGSAVGAPAVQTVQATEITDTSATLYGNLNPNGQNTQWWFEVDWAGHGAIYCPNQPGGQMSGSAGQTSVNCVVNNLQPSTTYTFQLYARWPGSATGWQGGGSLTFTTKPSTTSATSTVSTTAQTTTSPTSSYLQMTSQATSQTATSGSSLSDMLQENNMIITAALLVLAVALGVLTMRRRQHGARQPTGSTEIFCTKCGTENPASNEFCRSCGNRLRRISEAD